MILVITNDKRMTCIADELSEFFPVFRSTNDFKESNIKEVKFAVLPFKTDRDEMINLTKILPETCIIFTPVMRDFLENISQEIIIMMDYDEIAIYNSIPTAEGVIYNIIKNTEHTIHNSRIHIMGAGRCGETLAKNLKSLGARVTISSRNPALTARMFESGMQVVKEDRDLLANVDIIVNTVPAMVLDEEKLNYVEKSVYIADIATAPGGVDFEYAQKRGINAQLLPALPGIVAPTTSAKYLANFIKREINGRGNVYARN